MKPFISIVVPMYNEEKVIPIFFKRLNEVLKELSDFRFEIVVVNDGSKDQTLPLLRQQQTMQTNLVIVNLSRNFGHEPAVAAGLKTARGEAAIPMDADLQDPPELIQKLLEKYQAGYHVVNAKRASRKEDSFLKRFTASQFYSIIAKMSGKVKIPNNVGHFRLIARKVIDEVIQLQEKNRVFRVQVPYVGYRTTDVLFNRPKRAAGTTHYNYRSMTKLAVDAILATTHVPLFWPLWFWFYLSLGIGVSMLAQLTLWLGDALGWFVLGFNVDHGLWLTFQILGIVMSFLFLFLGIIAMYVSKIYLEVQNRPFYIIDEVYRKEI